MGRDHSIACDCTTCSATTTTDEARRDAIERDMRDSVFAALTSGEKIPWNDEPITLMKREVDKLVAENPEYVAARNREWEALMATPGGLEAWEAAVLGRGKDTPS